MTLSEIRETLKNAGIEDYIFESHILIKEFCGDSAPIPGKDYDSPALRKALRRRAAREPLQYILGKWTFFRETYFVSPECLIPRPDTEILVDELIHRLPRGARFLDLCTGSGCIAISLAKNRPDLSGTAADISSGALAIAKKNAAVNGVTSVNFLEVDVTAPCNFEGRFDCIIANPPYIPTKDVDALAPELSFEPRIALDGGDDGLDFYRAILKNFEKNRAHDGFFAFEFGYDQKNDAKKLAAAHGFALTEIYDLGGRFRAAVLTKQSEGLD